VSTTRRVVSGIVYVIRNGLQWKDAPKDYGPHKTLYNRFIRWSRLGVFYVVSLDAPPLSCGRSRECIPSSLRRTLHHQTLGSNI
jgi:transposase